MKQNDLDNLIMYNFRPVKLNKSTFEFIKSNGKCININEHSFYELGSYVYHKGFNYYRMRVNDFYQKTDASETNFSIDFFELTFLAQSCIPQAPIARTMFWQRLVNDIYHKLSDNDRERMYNFMLRDITDKNNKDIQWFLARYDKDNQYIVTTDHNGYDERTEAFLFKDNYYVGIDRFFNNKFIKKIEKKYI